jgi:signal transduction histidine kinase
MPNATRQELLAENENLRLRLDEAEETLRAIGSGTVDAFVVSGPDGEQVFTLKGADQPYRVLVETMSEGAVTLTTDGTILYCNNRLAAILQMPLEGLIGTQLGSNVAPADQAFFLDRLEACALDCGSTEIQMISGAGNLIPVLISCCPNDELSGNAKISMVVTDLTRQKLNEIGRLEAEQALYEETAKRLSAMENLREHEQMLIQQSRLAAMGEMIGNIAHQWRQPLNLLGLTVQQLLTYYDLGEFDRTFLAENISNSMKLIDHMSKTIDDFRNYFKPNKEKVEFKVQEAIANTLSLLEGSLQNLLIRVEITTKENPVIHGYPNEFAQVFLNLLINAKDVFREREIDHPELMITISEDCCSVVVTVADNAGGISEEIIDKIFEPYFTTKGPQGGTGVGLFMSKAIIENMGGRLTVSNVGDGAEFRIEVKK